MRLKFFSILFVLAVGSVLIFGFLSFGMAGYGSNHVCPVALSMGECPPPGNSFALAIHHISGLQQLSQFVVSVDLHSILFVVFLSAFVLFVFGGLIRFFGNQQVLYSKKAIIEEFSFAQIRKIFYWLSLHNKRDIHALYWAHGNS